jgi:hypothetical protein
VICLRALRAAAFAAIVVLATSATGCADESGSGERSTLPETAGERDQSGQGTQQEGRGKGSGNSGYRSELALIERAKPQPLVRPVSLKHAKRVKGPSGATYYLTGRKTKRTATAAVPGCDGGRPQPPGVTAKRVGPKRVLVTYRIGGGDEDCRAKWIQVVVDVSDDFLPGDARRFPIARKRSSQITLPVPGDLADADILVAGTRTKRYSGVASRTTTIRIRR